MNEHIKSALITFFVGFAIVLVPQIDTLTVESFNDGMAVGILFAAVRGGVKALLETFIGWYSQHAE